MSARSSSVKLRESFRDVTEFAGDDRPAILRQPLRDGVQSPRSVMKRAPAVPSGNVVVLRGEAARLLRAGLDRRRFDVGARIGMMRLDEADVIEEKFVAAGRAELAAFLEEDADFRRGAVVVVGQHLDDDRHFVRRVALEDDVLQDEFLVADAGAFLDGALDDVAGDARLARLFHGRGEPRISGRFGSAELGGDHDFFDEFADHLAFFQAGDFAFCVEPLASHTRGCISCAVDLQGAGNHLSDRRKIAMTKSQTPRSSQAPTSTKAQAR